MFENVDGQAADGRWPDGRAPVTGVLLAHQCAFGSGELIKQTILILVQRSVHSYCN